MHLKSVAYVAFSRDWIKNEACSPPHNVKIIMLYFLKWLTIRLKRSEKLGFPKIFFIKIGSI